jgi:hypothetical protein
LARKLRLIGQAVKDSQEASEDRIVQITNSATGQEVTIRVDNVVCRADGCLLVEAMFSGIVDLTAPSVNVAARLHPVRATAFEWIVTRQQPSVVPTGHQEGAAALTAGEAINVIPDVEIHVNRPEGGTLVRHFSEFLDQSRQLLEHGADEDVRSTTALGGFDPEAEPIVREMRDGSLLLVFGFLPPLVAETDASKARRFDLDRFGDEIAKALDVPVTQDDREVFVIQKPEEDTVEKVRHFLASYWHDTKKPWWRFW